ncbi:hypothetical protein ACVUMY_004121, partial [Acinetobacter baumannii]
NVETLVDILISRSPNFSQSKKEIFDHYYSFLKNDYVDEQINCGHDLTNIIACVFRQKEISLETNMDTKKIETALRLAYQKDFFKNTKLYKNTISIFTNEKVETVQT